MMKTDEEFDAFEDIGGGDGPLYGISPDSCPYCGGNCPSNDDHACDGYLGDIDGLVEGNQ